MRLEKLDLVMSKDEKHKSRVKHILRNFKQDSELGPF